MDAALKDEKEYLVSTELRRKETALAGRAHESLLRFTAYTKKDYEISWHHRVLAAYLDAFARKKIKRLMVFMPPRHGKSELVTRRLTAYMLGLNPNEQIVLGTYGASLAGDMNKDVQEIMDSPEYRSIFPETVIPAKGIPNDLGRKRNLEVIEMANREQYGYLKTVGVEGSLTGKGFTTGIIDDPHKDRAEADSETKRKKVWDWYTSTFSTRKNNKDAGICLLMTRWHEDDLAGRLLEQMRKDPKADQWVVVNMPALFEEPTEEFPVNINDKRKPGEALWPARYDEEYLEKERVQNSRDFAALFQGRPYTEGGAIWKKHWWRWYERIPRHLDQQIMSVDAAFKDEETSDFVVIQIWGRKGADKYLLDQIKDRMDFVETCKAIANMIKKWPKARSKYIEDKANGSAIISSFKRRVSGMIPVEPEGSKVARAHAVAPQIESGNVWLPIGRDWTEDFVDECAKFPNGKHDDQVDATSQGLSKLELAEAMDIRRLNQW